MARALSAVVAALLLGVAVAQVTQIISLELGGGREGKPNFVHIDPWSGQVKDRVPVAAAANISLPWFIAAHSPASYLAPYTFSLLVGSLTTRHQHTLIGYNARTLLPTGQFPDRPVTGDIVALVFDPATSGLFGFDVDEAATPRTHWFSHLSYQSGKMERLHQIPAPWVPRTEYDWVEDTELGLMYAVLHDNRADCAFGVFNVKDNTSKPIIKPLPARSCLHNLMLQSNGQGKAGTVLSFCQPDFPRFHNATLCIVDPQTAATTVVSRVFHEEGDNFHTAVAFSPGWVFASGVNGGRQWLFNYNAKNVTELPHRVPQGRFFVAGNSYTL